MCAIIVSILFVVKGSAIDPADVERSIEICEFRGGLAPIVALPGLDINYYCKDGYQPPHAQAPAGISAVRADFEQYVKKEGLDMHLGFTDGKYSSRDTQAAFSLFSAGAEVK